MKQGLVEKVKKKKTKLHQHVFEQRQQYSLLIIKDSPLQHNRNGVFSDDCLSSVK